MANYLPATAATTADILMESQLVRILDLIVNQGLSQAEACRQAGLPLRTFQRNIGHSRVLADIRRQTDGVLAAGVLSAYEGYLDGINKLKAAIANPDTSVRDMITAFKALHLVLKSFGGNLVVTTPGIEGQEESEPKRVSVAFDSSLLLSGPVTVQIGQRDGIPELLQSLTQPEID